MANLKTEVDKVDIDKLATVPVDLSKLGNVVKNDFVKKTVYDKLVAKVKFQIVVVLLKRLITILKLLK